jgi:hypothetical protein
MANCFGLRTARLGAACPHGRPRLHFLEMPFVCTGRLRDPIILPDGRKLLTLKMRPDYITKLPKRESDLPEWQAAIEALMPCGRGDAVKLRIYDSRWSADKAALFALSLHDNFFYLTF